MKKCCVILLLFGMSLSLFSQNQYSRFPYKYNAFVTTPNIKWACEMYGIHEFEPAGKPAFEIYQYIINGQGNGTLKSYINKDFDTVEIKKWKKKELTDYYIEVKKEFGIERRRNLEISNSIEFHEIFYLENYKLKSQVVSAGPQFKVVTSSGIYIGNSVPSFSSVNYTAGQVVNKNDKIILLGSTEQTINFDSLESTLGLKKMYGNNLAMALWYGLSKGSNKVIDLKNEKVIPPVHVMSYVIADSVLVKPSAEQQVQDEITLSQDTSSLKWIPGPPAYQSFSDISIQQDWYYNKTKDIFFTKIAKAYIHTRYYDEKDKLYKTEKRFQVIF